MEFSNHQEKVGQPKINKKLAKRQLWIEYVKGSATVLAFLAGLALVSNYINIYFAIKYGFVMTARPWYSNLVLLFCVVAYIFVFFAIYKKLGFKLTERIDDLRTMIDRLE